MEKEGLPENAAADVALEPEESKVEPALNL